ncbi:DUF5919 domain-containing protein [Haloglycomyces albus]|uniref:DUF5919 domain-containing protein n=1 Tax=Haloglycomyces albus TaxID=526067 RepID=UPI00046CE757|nr:DUF5919 domain-containing protein [Haloglycomyces albus]
MNKKVVSLHKNRKFRANLGNLARQQIVDARLALGMDHTEFASKLADLLGWPVEATKVESWETSATPPGDVALASNMLLQHASPFQGSKVNDDMLGAAVRNRYADVTAVYPTRSQFTSEMSAHEIFDDASEIKAAGLSLNTICQQYPTERLVDLIENGTSVELLFLNPTGTSINEREEEEGFQAGYLSALTQLNIDTVSRVLTSLSDDALGRFEIRLYDEPIRFNLLFVNDEVGVAQPYLPASRGVDSPTFVLEKTRQRGLYQTFRSIYLELWDRGTISGY